VNARELAELFWLLVFWLINLINGFLILMSILLVPPLPGGSGTFSIATWNIDTSRENHALGTLLPDGFIHGLRSPN
jgi:hypothetical protein